MWVAAARTYAAHGRRKERYDVGIQHTRVISSKLTRHITRREIIVREREDDDTLAVEKVDTDDNLSDMFTKVLDRTPYTKLRKLVMNLLVRSATAAVPRARRGTSVMLRGDVCACRGVYAGTCVRLP